MEREKIEARILVEANIHIHHHHHHAPRAVSSTLTFRGGNMASGGSILVGQTIQAIYTEFDGPNGTGNVVPPTGLVGYTSDNTAVATVDATSGICTGVSAGTANISASDGGLPPPGLPASGVLTVSAAAAAVSSTLTFGAPSAAAKLTVDASGAPVKGRAPAK